ncbi:peptidase S10 [Novosphingobium sp. PC22D]|uniref:S10 family peptidase n=1 Tax=Novosphingobium sp. PC22D TaxID=1962403 RepID=UPI000BF20C64|nr:peptidase S10 [Novosphingobium sp. PC22D]PEQ13139.1 peptidase S10 [Novosphingobium sp. PC22D]
MAKLTRAFLLPIATLSLAAPVAVFAQDSAPDKKPVESVDKQHREDVNASAAQGWASAPVEEREVSSRHSVSVGGRNLAYTATAGTLTLRTLEGKPTASMFYVAYTLDGKPAGTRRPVTFLYNGGPGSPSFWLHMGSFAPVRLETGDPVTIGPPPYRYGPNPQTLLDKTDLVFLDAIGAGYSRPLGDAKPQDFYGVDQDVNAFATAIQRYITRYERWNSPKFVLGESYGTLRSGALAYEMQQRGMALNGVILLSSIMNYGYRQPGLDQVYINYLPSYAATAWYHNKLPDRPADVASVVERARQFALGPYASALAKGQSISPEERRAVAEQLSALTGLSTDFIIRANLRVDLYRFQKELLRDQRLSVGRFDSRYTGPDSDAAGEGPDSDKSSDAISGAFIASFRDYLGRELGYRSDMPYRLSARDAEGWTWNWQHKAAGGNWPQNNPNTAVDLAAAMRENPYLKVLSLNGYYDMATPFFGTENDLGHMMLEPREQQNLVFRYYHGGHMTYVNPEALAEQKADIAAFIDSAVR